MCVRVCVLNACVCLCIRICTIQDAQETITAMLGVHLGYLMCMCSCTHKLYYKNISLHMHARTRTLIHVHTHSAVLFWLQFCTNPFFFSSLILFSTSELTILSFFPCFLPTFLYLILQTIYFLFFLSLFYHPVSSPRLLLLVLSHSRNIGIKKRKGRHQVPRNSTNTPATRTQWE